MAGKRRVLVGANEREVTSGADGRFEVAGRQWTAASATPGEWRLVGDEGAARVFVAGPPESPWVFFNGRVYAPEVTDASQPRRARSVDSGALSAPMPATVRSVLVTPGATVAAGQTLIVLEAMKMELPLRAPVAGTITRVDCGVGDLVQPGTPLVELK
jgi:biotin carboxyl carrier protein